VVPRAALLVLLLSLGAYANSLGNRFAYDDNAVIALNPVATSGDWRGALSSPYHPDALEGAGLYRPLVSASFSAEWEAYGGRPFGFHLGNLLTHTMVSLLLFLLLLELGSPMGALAGAAVFAVHPVHTEAVANVVGRAELYGALFYLAACLLYWRGAGWSGWRRGVRLVGLAGFYLLSLASKEIGVTLPATLVLLEWMRPSLARSALQWKGDGSGNDLEAAGLWQGFGRRLRREGGAYLLFAAVLLAYLVQRTFVLGTVKGEVPAPIFSLLGPWERVLTGLSLWPEYLRLLLLPLDLSSDYAPGVLFPAEGLTPGVALGSVILLALGYGVVRALGSRPGAPLVALGILWFVLTILPVSNLLFPVGVLMAERILYLPSVGLSLGVTGLWGLVRRRRPSMSRALGMAIGVVVCAMMVRTVLRNPAWMDTFTVLETLNRDHPESHLAFLNRGLGLESVGELDRAGEELEMALRLAPERYGTLTAMAGFLGRTGEWDRAEELLRRAMALAPSRDDAYRLLSTQLLRRGEGRAAHSVALAGLARAGFHADLWGNLSESYVLKGDLEAAVRARRAAISANPSSTHHRARMAAIQAAREEG
jgi:tetratricopeptide (TPR) repeat protein